MKETIMKLVELGAVSRETKGTKLQGGTCQIRDVSPQQQFKKDLYRSDLVNDETV
jgi:hypothetical protein